MLDVRLKGQSTLEYVLLFSFVLAALIAMGAYMKRGTEGKIRESTDQIGDQYDARDTSSAYTIVTHLKQTETTTAGGGSVIDIAAPADNTRTKTGSETVHQW